MLGVLVAQVFAGVTIAALIVGFLTGHSLAGWQRETVRPVKRGDRGRWTEVVWVVGALVVTFWSIGVLAAPAYAYRWPTFPDFPYSSVIQILGFCLAMAGGILFFAAARALGPQMTPAIQLREGHRLVEEGPYRYIRHPAYTAILASGAGLAVLYLSLPLALLVVLLVGLANYRARLEEELLSAPDAFGESYETYASRTGRFLPRFHPRA